MAVNWNALQTPNHAAALGQGMEFKNALDDRKYARERDMMQDQRYDRQEQRLERRDTLEAQRYEAQTRQAEAAARAERLKHVAGILKTTPAEQRQQRYRSMAPALQQLGWTPEQIEAGGQTLDDASLEAFIGKVDQELQFFQTDRGILRGDKRSGDVEMAYEMAPKPKGEWRERVIGPNGETELVWVEEPTAGPAGPSPRPSGPATPAVDLRTGVDALTKIGARVTSGYRDPAHNARVGGVANSYHTRGSAENPMAYDLVPPQGMTMEQLAAEARRVLPGYDVINEDDHVHVEPSSVAPYQVAQAGGTPSPPSGGRSMRWDAPQAKKGGRMATPEEVKELGLSGQVWLNADGKPDPIGGAGQNNPRKAEADLRKEFNARPEVKEFRNVSTSYRQIEALTKGQPTAANDMSLIFSYMKMLDPGSVVREGEFANAQNTAGIPDRVRNAYNKALNGQRLNEKQRAEFTSSARTIYQTQERRFGEIASEYRSYAQDYGVDPNRVASVQQAAAPQAKAGDFSAQQRATAQRLAKAPNFKKLPVGSRGRPYAPRTEAEFKAVKPGSFYIDDDGQVYQKGR